MNIVMTGSTGLLGKKLKSRLESMGHRILTIGRKDFPVDSEKLKDAEGLIHLAGENIAAKRWTAARKKALRDSRIETARQLGEGLKSDLKFVISASGIGIYGDRGGELLSENSSPGEGFLSQLCRDWEAAADLIPANRHVKLRLGVVMSAEGGFFTEVAPIFKRIGASRLGSGKQWFSWVHIDDAIEVFLSAVNSEQMAGVYNVTSPEPVTNRELTHEMAKALGVWPAPPAPKFALKLLYGELAQALLSSQRGIPERLIRAGFQFKFPELSKALSVIAQRNR